MSQRQRFGLFIFIPAVVGSLFVIVEGGLGSAEWMIAAIIASIGGGLFVGRDANNPADR